MNYSDSERVAAALNELGHIRARSGAEADLYIFNTCSIRQKGEDRVMGLVVNLGLKKRRNKRLLVGLTGCMVRTTSTKNSPKAVQDKLIKDLKDVDFVFRIEDAKKLGTILEEAAQTVDLSLKAKTNHKKSGSKKSASPRKAPDARLDYLGIKPKYTSPFQAFVPIQIGCDKYCTYCIVPYARGREQSRPAKEILAECKELVKNGCKEITLVGQTVNSYGKSDLDIKSGAFPVAPAKASSRKNIKEPFVALLTEVDKLRDKGLSRLRFTSSHPYDFTVALIKSHKKLKTLTPHFHIPIQSGSDETLKRMNRRYTAEHYRNLVKTIRSLMPGASVTTDIIVGFCGEKKSDFAKSLKLFKEIKWDMAYLARYSPRPGTVSFKYFKDDVTHAEKARRWHALNNVLNKSSLDYNKKLIGKTLEVLVEKYDPKTKECEGKSRENKVVQFPGSPKMRGTLQKVKITKALKWNLKGRHFGAKARSVQ